MNNVNVVSTPNIEGNIGSCTTKKTTVIIGRDGLLTLQKQDIATNSCTGHVTTSNYWVFSEFTFIGGIIMFVIGIGILIAIFDR